MIYIIGDLVQVTLPADKFFGRTAIVVGRVVEPETHVEKVLITFQPDVQANWMIRDDGEIVDGPKPRTLYSIEEKYLERLV